MIINRLKNRYIRTSYSLTWLVLALTGLTLWITSMIVAQTVNPAYGIFLVFLPIFFFLLSMLPAHLEENAKRIVR
jgi:FtsH-binding integral membrane protein